MRAVLTFCGLLACSAAVAGEPIPALDVDGMCTAAAHGNNTMRNDCIEKNQAGYNILKLYAWEQASYEAQEKCLFQMASMRRSDGSLNPYAYYYLEMCIADWRPVDEAKRLRDGDSHFRP